MKQTSLVDDPDGGTALRSVGVPDSRATLSKAQKLFNMQIASIESQRQFAELRAGFRQR